VAEVTPTNPVVNLIWPVAGDPVTVTVQAGHSVPITLTGGDTGQGPLTFEIASPPRRGTLAGSAPNLTYTAPSGFAGAGAVHVHRQQRDFREPSGPGGCFGGARPG
jgi:hypothetical protein